MTLIRSFPPVDAPGARVLVLGSMPGRLSLEKQQYYAHPRNCFWFIMGRLFGFRKTAPYAERIEALRRSGVALWDVIGSCSRTGSLDAGIDSGSVRPNEVAALVLSHQGLRAVFFNGGTAEQAFRKHVAPQLAAAGRRPEYRRLPSTSPAHAGMTRDQKLAEWQVVRDYAAKDPAG